ncbi:A24 family peptidase [Nocardiopsis sp. Huas11]|uniref:prepilin peptidase n=1 Tax=Nocardiopsis sp. Huas11 TaxID=2183912 RepID=UPI000EB31962|nr:A24 family peptidase [Nocardiopsis sp. Huas11]
MTTPSTLGLDPTLWTVTATASLALIGLGVGHVAGRLVYLFGSAEPAGDPRPGGASRTLAAPAGRGDAAEPAPGGASAPGAPLAHTEGEDDEGPPPPRCPFCRAELSFVPWTPTVASRAFRRRGACPHCEQVVRPHLAVVIATGALFAVVGVVAVTDPRWSPVELLAVLWLAALTAVLSVIDLRVLRLPDPLVGPGYAVAFLLFAAAVFLPPTEHGLDRAGAALVSMVLVTVLYWLLWRVSPRGFGFGDVKLSGLTGLYAGWAAGPMGALVAVFWAFAAFSVLGLVLLALRRIRPMQPFPLGPFMLGATLVTVLVGAPLVVHP